MIFILYAIIWWLNIIKSLSVMTDLFSESCCVPFYNEGFSVAWWSRFMLCLRVLTCWDQPLHHNHSMSQPRIAPPTVLSLTIIHTVQDTQWLTEVGSTPSAEGEDWENKGSEEVKEDEILFTAGVT